MTDPKQFYEQWPSIMGNMKKEAPAIAKGFGLMYKELMGEGKLSVREKELIAIGIALAIRCESCVLSHVEKAVKMGVTREELLELAGVVVAMQGGPGYVHVPELIAALDALEA
jgi:AhpD family alkylhydroperoxidase